MLAVFATGFDPADPLAHLRVGELDAATTPDDWVTVHVRAASVNHHDLWTLRGPAPAGGLPMILGTDAAGVTEDGREVKMWFPGGSSSPVLTADDLDLAYDFNTLAKAGSMLGSGAIIVVDDTNSVVDVCLWLAEFYRHESCGKCTPCREGTNWTVKMLERIQSGLATPMDLDIMASVQEQIIGNCLCVLGDAMAMPVGSMVAKFRGEFEAHIEAARAKLGIADDPADAPELALIQGAFA